MTINFQQLRTATPAVPLTGSEIVPLWQNGSDAGGILNQLTALLLGGTVVTPSGDTSGATDSTAFAAAQAAFIAAIGPAGVFSSNTGNLNVILTAGDYYVSVPQSMLGYATNLKATGLRFVGAGGGLTRVHFVPSGAPSVAQANAMLVNQGWLNLQFIGITWWCNTPGWDWIQRQEQPLSNIQYPLCSDCNWEGSWQYIDVLTGNNNNSEAVYFRCSVGTALAWLFSPAPGNTTITNGSASISVTGPSLAPGATVYFPVGSACIFNATIGTGTGGVVSGTSYYVVSSTITSGATTALSVSATPGGTPITFNAGGTTVASCSSDQFLNYRFDDCQCNPNTQWVNMAAGGHVKITKGDCSGGSPTVPTYLFNLFGIAHAQGVCTFEADLRRESHNANALLIQQTWNYGSIVIKVDESSIQSNPASTVYALMNANNTTGAIIYFHDSLLLGVHNYPSAGNIYQFQEKVIYERCTLLQQPSADAFITQSGTGYPIVDFNDCRTNDSTVGAGYKNIVDCTLNWNGLMGGHPKLRMVQLCGPSGNMPVANGSYSFNFPDNVRLVRVQFVPFNTALVGAYNFTLTINGVLVIPALAGSNAGAAAAYDTNVSTPGFYFNVAEGATTLLVLTDALSGGRTSIFNLFDLIVTYMG